MSAGDDNETGQLTRSARELLEQFMYGHIAEVEQILRFAREQRLEDDNLVFLLTSILKVNERLVEYILRAIGNTERVIDNARAAGEELRALEQKLTAQIEEAANRSAGKLNIAADRFTVTLAKVDALCGGMTQVADSLVQVEGVLNRAVALRNGENQLDRLIGQIRRQALADITSYHDEIMKVLSREVRRESWAIHAYGITGSVVAISMIFAWLLRH